MADQISKQEVNYERRPQPYWENIKFQKRKKGEDLTALTGIKRTLTAQHNLIIVGGVSLDAVSHEESVRARGDEGMTRSHNLKAQEAECA